MPNQDIQKLLSAAADNGSAALWRAWKELSSVQQVDVESSMKIRYRPAAAKVDDDMQWLT